MEHQSPRHIVDRYFEAMKRGQEAEDTLFALFADDATYVEPFTGATRTHEGIDAIKGALQGSWAQTPPDLVLTVQRIDVDGEVVTSDWTCDSPVFEKPVQGRDVCTVREGRIVRLEVTFVS